MRISSSERNQRIIVTIALAILLGCGSGTDGSPTARAFDLVFANERTAYLAVRSVPFGASLLIFVSRDGGGSWDSVDVPAVGLGTGNVALLARGGAIELLRADDGPPHVEPIDGTPSLPQVLTPAGTIDPASSASTVGARGWAAISVASDPSDLAHVRPGIFSSIAPGEPWIEQPVEAAGFVNLRAIDLCSTSTGVAGGFGFALGAAMLDPVILHTTSDGARWEQSAIEGVSSGTLVQSVLCTHGESAWAITTDFNTGIGSRLLHSADGGATWTPASASVGERTQLRGLGRSTERE